MVSRQVDLEAAAGCGDTRREVGAGAFIRDYSARHENPWNRALHAVGVPLAPIAFVVLLALGEFAWAAAAFVAGYALQWIGHRIERNSMWDSLEGQLVKALLAPFRALRARV
jgi:hypothetical protein